ncbi:PGAP2-interacting protein-like [Acanthaster planci]|uniref:PGAP2-interacting protein-like n=1 Tax=Acanthaster planci TaxID=133434 RepID=A0A8B7XZY1_ACAPL|nr:PGAP2-interacting protein-like [Acanthaster planci]
MTNMATTRSAAKRATEEAERERRGDISQDEKEESVQESEEPVKQSEDAEKPKVLPVKPRTFLRELLSESILGFIFWSVFHGLAPMVWFYPMNELQITGYEALGLIWLLPVVCTVGAIRNAVETRWGLFVLRLVCVLSIGSFQASTTLQRLVFLTVGNGAATLLLCGMLWNRSLHQRSSSFWGLMIGFFALLVSRVWYVSLNPTWSDARANSIIITLGVIATIDRFLSVEYPEPQAEPDPAMASSWRRTAMGFGSLLFLTHWLFGEVSVICRWTVKGVPYPGPSPFPGGAAVFVELLTGMLMSSKKDLPTNFLWSWFIGLHCFLGLYYLNAYLGFFCGLMLSMYVMSIWPEMVDRLTSCPPAKTLTAAMAIYLFAMLFSVWTTAYNFVPGGVYTREQTGLLGAFLMFNIVRALLQGKARDHQNPLSKHIAFPNLDGTGTYQIFADAKIYFVLLLVIGGGGFFSRFHPEKYQAPAKANPREFTGMVWTAHFMYDNRGWPSYERSAKMIEDSGADVIALIEADASKPYLGLNDISMWFGERLGMYDDFGPSTKSHTWGSLFLSKFPIVYSDHLLLPSPKGELAPGLHMTVNISGSLVDFVTAHMGNTEDDVDRRLQAEVLSNITRRSKNPTVFMGYVTSEPGSRDYTKFTTFGKLLDIDPTDKDRFCEYIFYKGLIRKAYARISKSDLSDTEVQLAKFVIPDTKTYRDNDAVTTNKEDVHESEWLPKVFGSHYVGDWHQDSHHYHMDTPKYFYHSKDHEEATKPPEKPKRGDS